MPDTGEKTQPDAKSIKDQRDRFLAFAFASSDLFIEVSEEGKVTHAIGASKGITGVDEKALIGKKWLELFSVYEQSKMIDIFERAKPAMRCGPMLINLSDSLGARKAILTAIKMPGSNQFYLDFGLSSAIMARISHALGDGQGFEILGRDDFTEAAQTAFSRARAIGQEVFLTIFDFAPTGMARKRMGEPPWKKLRQAVSEYLVAESIDGYTAGEIFDGRFAVVHDKKLDAPTFNEKVTNLTMQADPSGQGVEIKCKSLSIDFKTISERETEKAVTYAIDEFYGKGEGMRISSINGALEAYLAANNLQIKEFKGIIERAGFVMHYQPIIDLKSNEPRYYEMLCRFEKGHAREWIKFAEDTGLIGDFDMSVCERAIQHVKFKAGNTRTKFSANISPQSLENPEFCEKLLELLTKEKAQADRIIFEISNSSHIRNIVRTGSFIAKIQTTGFKVALDDFRDGAQTSDMLNAIHPDIVKIASHHIRALLTVQRDTAIVKNIIDSCKALNIDVIGVHVEDKGQASVLRDLGADAAQGHYFGKAGAKIEYAPPRDWS